MEKDRLETIRLAIKNSDFFKIKVSDDKMVVYLSINTFDRQSALINKFEAIMKSLKKECISYGINEDSIKSALKEVVKEDKPLEDVVIAEGMQPINGGDGKVEFLFNTKGHRPHGEISGAIDYHDLKIVDSVDEEQELARLIQPGVGKAGKDVYGRIIKPIAGKICELPPTNENARISESNKNVIVSNIDGNVKFDGRAIIVNAGFEVENNVDLSVGNISCKGYVDVKGSVKSGFKIEAGGKVSIAGYVEDAMIKSGDDVEIKGGFVGSGNGKIEATGNVYIGFARNQTIIGNNVYITREAVDCEIYAKENVVVSGRRISIIGGLITAGSKIEAEVFGSKTETPTAIEVGVDYTAKKVLLVAKKELNELTSKLKTTNTEIETIEEIKKFKHELPAKYRQKLTSLVNLKSKISENIIDLNQRIKIASKSLPVNNEAKIIVNNIAYPGVNIKIGAVTESILDKTSRSMFYLDKGEIKRG